MTLDELMIEHKVTELIVTRRRAFKLDANVGCLEFNKIAQVTDLRPGFLLSTWDVFGKVEGYPKIHVSHESISTGIEICLQLIMQKVKERE